MNDGEHDLHRWLADDISVLNGVLIVAASSVALVLVSFCVWRAKCSAVPADPSSSKDHREHDTTSSASITPSMLTAALASLHIVSAASTELDRSAVDQPVSSTDPSASLDAEQKAHKGPRSKERRRRGKDPYKELLRGGKKSKALLKAIRADEHEFGRSDSPLPDTDSRSSTSGNDTLLSRSESLDPHTRETLDDDQTTPPASTERPAASTKCDIENVATALVRTSTPCDTLSHDGSTSFIPSHRSSRADSNHSQSPAPETAKIIVPASVADRSAASPTTHSSVICPPDPSIPSDASAPSSQFVQPISSMPNLTSTTSDWDREREPQVESNGAHRVQPTPLHSKSHAQEEGSIAKITISASAPSHLPSNDGSALSSPIFSTIPSPVSSPHSSPVVPPITFPSLNPLPLNMRDDTINGAGPSTPILSRGATPSSQISGQASSQGSSQTGAQVSAQTQLASMRGALEAARLREEKSRAEAERVSKECEELRWRWNEDAGAWRRREAELQAQTHHLMQQLHAYAAVLSSFQSQHAAGRPSTSFSSPTSPSLNMRPHSSPRLQHHPVPFPLSVSSQFQNPAGAPVHVQAMLASAPMLTSHHQGLAGGFNGMNSTMGITSMSPLMWSGLGFAGSNRNGNGSVVGQHTPDSSASGSPSRGRRRSRQAEDVRSASDDSSLGDWDGAEESSGGLAEDVDLQRDDGVDEEEDDIFHNNVLADAILKRPESLRGLSGSGKRIGSSRVPSRTSVVSNGSAGSFFHTPKGKDHEGRTNNEQEEIVMAASGSGADVVEQSALEEPNVTVKIASVGEEALSASLGDSGPPDQSGQR